MSLASGSQKCTYTHPSGEQCKAWAVRESAPARCVAHPLEGKARVGAPVGNKNRQTHGFYSQPVVDLKTIGDVVLDVLRKQAALSAFIEQEIASGEMDVASVSRLLALHGQNASRAGRLFRDQRALSGDSADGLLQAIGKALDELSTELGIEL